MVQVKVNEGVLEGEVVQNEFGGQFCSFKGIPYAEPPVGNLRFKAPQPKKSWDGVRSAKEFGSVCYQYDQLFSHADAPIGDEDCLFLNVYTPDLKPKKALPVMFWIHGGGFTCGSGNDDFYGPEFLVKHEVVLVTINYRLEALGFLSLDTEEIPGNAGMKDQVAALRWVKENIKSFGGDPENITIFGESAGGASVSYHLVSPMTKGLFKRAIVMSGALTCWWAQAFEPRERALKLAKQLGFDSEDDKELAEFFRSVPAEKLVRLSLPITRSKKQYELSIAISSEKEFGDSERFFYGDPIDALKNGIHEDVKVMTGFTADEGLLMLGVGVSLDDYISEANAYKEFFVPKPIQLNCPIKDQLEVGRKVKEFYFKKGIITTESIDQLVKLFSYDMFINGSLLFSKLISEKNDVYLYKFTCKSERNVFAHFFGLSEFIKGKQVVSHVDDLFYLFPFKVANLKVDQNSETYGYINRMSKIWTNFAKFGTPTVDDSLGAEWPLYTTSKKDYMDLGNQMVATTNPNDEEDVFWNEIFKKYLPSYAV